MSNYKFTPGEWELETHENFVSKYRIYATSDGANVGWFDPDEETKEAGEANAKLISAAPDLLEACINLVSQIKDLRGNGYLRELKNEINNQLSAVTVQAEKIIQKATGQ